MGTVTTQILMNPFLVFGAAPAPATFILRSEAGASLYLLEDGTSNYLLEDGTSKYQLETGGGGGGNILRSPSDGSKIERSD